MHSQTGATCCVVWALNWLKKLDSESTGVPHEAQLETASAKKASVPPSIDEECTLEFLVQLKLVEEQKVIAAEGVEAKTQVQHNAACKVSAFTV